jgi:hypothetical protein
VRLVALALTIAISATIACRRVEGQPRSPQSVTPTPASAGPREPSQPSIGFHSPRQLTEHFEKHGPEFGPITRAEYLSRAQRLRDAPLGGNILEAVRTGGVITRFDRTTGAFIAFDHDRTIRTFFRPNDGEGYFHRQAHR